MTRKYEMKIFTIQDIRSWNPCYDPNRYLPEDWSGTAVDILNMEVIPPQDRLWVVLREKCIDSRTLRLFAVNCAKQALARVPNPDPRSLVAIEVAERFANGLAIQEELARAADAAYAAAYAAHAAARAAADYAAARAAADYAAAYAAARAAADYAAADAADAVYTYAAVRTADAAERQEQVKQLLLLLGETV